jgi:V8-like Glu-specific endopeptidase
LEDVDVEALWTDELIKSAVPLDMEVDPDPQAAEMDINSLPMEPPLIIPGWNGEGLEPDFEPIELDIAGVEPDVSPPFASPPSSPTDYCNYAPFQRFNFPGAYMRYPRSTVGKLFFYQDADGNGTGEGPFSCTASVYGTNAIATAGHCVHNGRGGGYNGGFSYNAFFCPSYDNGINSRMGCWTVTHAITNTYWGNNRAFDRDYGCMVTATTGSVHSRSVGNVTGTTGQVYNLTSRNATIMWGYPAAAPFTGDKIINTFSTEWYQINMTSGDGNYSKYIGNDQHSGNSGGPWWINYTHPFLNYADTDGSACTNPGQGSPWPFINGVNSHYRTGYTQEEGSPQFTSSSSDGGDAYDVLSACGSY